MFAAEQIAEMYIVEFANMFVNLIPVIALTFIFPPKKEYRNIFVRYIMLCWLVIIVTSFLKRTVTINYTYTYIGTILTLVFMLAEVVYILRILTGTSAEKLFVFIIGKLLEAGTVVLVSVVINNSQIYHNHIASPVYLSAPFFIFFAVTITACAVLTTTDYVLIWLIKRAVDKGAFRKFKKKGLFRVKVPIYVTMIASQVFVLIFAFVNYAFIKQHHFMADAFIPAATLILFDIFFFAEYRRFTKNADIVSLKNAAESAYRAKFDSFNNEYAMYTAQREQNDRAKAAVEKCSQALVRGDEQAAVNSLNELSQIVAASAARRICEHSVINTILCSKAAAAENIGVKLVINADTPENLPFRGSELCCILSNMLDNAIAEAAAQAPDKRRVSVDIITVNDWLILATENSTTATAKLNGKLPQTTKSEQKEHGIGLMLVNRIAETHGGVLKLNNEGGKFSAVVSLPIREEVESSGKRA